MAKTKKRRAKPFSKIIQEMVPAFIKELRKAAKKYKGVCEPEFFLFKQKKSDR